MDLDNYSRSELLQLRDDIDRALKSREENIRRDLRRKMNEMAAAEGLTLDDVFNGRQASTDGKRSRGGQGSVPPKYRHPTDGSITWTGRGRKPRWVEDWISNNRSIDELLINN